MVYKALWRSGDEPHARHAQQTPKEHGPRARGITPASRRPRPAEPARPARAGNHIRSDSCASDTIRDPARRDRRIDDGFGNVNRRIDDTNRRIDDTNRRIDDMQTDIRELRTLIFEVLKSEQAPAN